MVRQLFVFRLFLEGLIIIVLVLILVASRYVPIFLVIVAMQTFDFADIVTPYVITYTYIHFLLFSKKNKLLQIRLLCQYKLYISLQQMSMPSIRSFYVISKNYQGFSNLDCFHSRFFLDECGSVKCSLYNLARHIHPGGTPSVTHSHQLEPNTLVRTKYIS